MRLILNRYYSDKECTLGCLTIEGMLDPILYTIEKPWLDNEPYNSCIPAMSYKVKPFSGAKYSDVWQIMDVPNRTHILFHAANWARQLEGCIAPGLANGYLKDPFDDKLKKAVRESGQAIIQMKKILSYPSEFDLVIWGRPYSG